MCETVEKGLNFGIILKSRLLLNAHSLRGVRVAETGTHLQSWSPCGGRSLAAPGTLLETLVNRVIKCISLCRGKTTARREYTERLSRSRLFFRSAIRRGEGSASF